MSKFKKKPVVVEAVQFTEESKNQCFNFVTCNKSAGRNLLTGTAELSIQTLEGVMVASVGDWIIKGVNGEFYPCKPDIFEKTYEPVPSGKHQQSKSDILKYFTYDHLPDALKEVSKPLSEIANMLDELLPNCAEKSAGMRKLLEAKDCFVRARMESK